MVGTFAVTVLVREDKESATAHFRLNAARFYVAARRPPEPIASAMNKGQLAAGMTLEEATLVLGEPTEKSAHGDGVERVAWVKWEQRAAVSSDGGNTFSSPPKQLVYSWHGNVRDGKLVDVTGP